MNPFDLSGKTALVTGSTRGLGRAMAESLARCGASVALNYYNNTSNAESVLADFTRAGMDAALFQADVTEETSVNQMVADIEGKFGPVDIIVINATCDQPHHPIEDYDWAFYQTMLDFFVKSPYLLTRACLASMKKRKFGRIINIGSEVLHLGVPNFSAYVAAKGGQNGWTRSMARELAPFGITVNMIAPGWIPVERHEKEPQEWKDAYFPGIPIGRWGVPQDLGGAVAFLASEASSFITGANLHVNGGNTVH